ncbi:MAG: hypothetical protein SNJ81_15520, partial [Cyanobacteriota bacterium]
MSAPSSHLHSTPSPSANPLDEDAAAVSVAVEVLADVAADGSGEGQSGGRSQPPTSPTPTPASSDSRPTNALSGSSTSSSALATTRGSFSSFLAPLTQDTFKQVVTDVEQKLRVVNQTLSMLDNLMDSQGFDAILNEMLHSITLKTGELLNADRATIFLLDEEKDELWAIVAE